MAIHDTTLAGGMRRNLVSLQNAAAALEQTYRALLEEVLDAGPSTRRWLDPIDEVVRAGKYYAALKLGRRLLGYEKELLSNVR